MQNVASILKSDDAFPDVMIYHRAGGYVGLALELKRIDSGAILKDGSLSMSKHVQDQHRCHEKLRALGWRVEFAEGAEEAKRIFLAYINKS